MQQMLHENQPNKYVIKVNGKVVSIPFSTKMLAEQNIANLPQEQQVCAEVVAVTPDGREIFFG